MNLHILGTFKMHYYYVKNETILLYKPLTYAYSVLGIALHSSINVP